MHEGKNLSISPGISGVTVSGRAAYAQKLCHTKGTPDAKGSHHQHWSCWVTPTDPKPLLLDLTSSGSQVAVEGNVSLAHGQEVCADIWNDRRVHYDTWVKTPVSSTFHGEPPLMADCCALVI